MKCKGYEIIAEGVDKEDKIYRYELTLHILAVNEEEAIAIAKKWMKTHGEEWVEVGFNVKEVDITEYDFIEAM